MKDLEIELMETKDVKSTTLKQMTWQTEGETREAYVYVPQKFASPNALIFAFHGHGGTGLGFGTKQKFEEYWLNKAIVVYPTGLPTPSPTDRDGTENGWQRRVGEVDYHTQIVDKDIKFFDVMLKDFLSNFNVNPDLVFVHGWSNGGLFAYNCLWTVRGSKIAAIAPAAAVVNTTNNKVHLPDFHIAGTADPVVGFNSQENTAMKVRDYNDCNANGFVWATGDYDLLATKYPSSNQLPVIFCHYDGGHAYTDNVPPLIVKFFRQVTYNKS